MTATDNRPHALPVLDENIPPEFRAGTAFVVWKYQWRNGTWTKPPFNARTRASASHSKPDTWSTFDQALTTYRSHGFDGIGRALTAGDGFAGWDLDECLDPESGELDDWALALVSRFASYTEISPSGRGLRILTRGRLPFTGKRKDPIEVYSALRYLTLTGHRWPGTPATIEERQAEIDTTLAEIWPATPRTTPTPVPNTTGNNGVSNQAIIDNLLRNDKGRRLWNGDTSLHDNNHSRADSALCAKLAYYTGHDPARIDELFRRSDLMRDKWDAKRGDTTYGGITISGVLDIMSDYYEWNPPTLSIPETPQHEPRGEKECGDQVAGLMARIDQLEARLREVDVPRHDLEEIERQAEEIRRLKDERTRFFEVLRNPHLKGIGTTALAVFFSYKSAESRGKATEGWVDIRRGQIAENSGNKPGTVTKHLDVLENDLGLLERDTTRIPTRRVDPDTGEIQLGWESCSRIRLRLRTFEDFSQELIDYTPDRPERRGGYRPRCIHHPEAGTIVNRTVRCAECETVLEETETFVPAEPEIQKDENHLSEPPSPPMWSRTYRDENQLSAPEATTVIQKDKLCLSESDSPVRPKNRCRCGANAGDGELCSDCAGAEVVLAREQRRLKGQHRGRHER